MSWTKEEIDLCFSKESMDEWYSQWNSDFMLNHSREYELNCLLNEEIHRRTSIRENCDRCRAESLKASDQYIKKHLVNQGYKRHMISKGLIDVYKPYLQLKRIIKNESQKSTQ